MSKMKGGLPQLREACQSVKSNKAAWFSCCFYFLWGCTAHAHGGHARIIVEYLQTSAKAFAWDAWVNDIDLGSHLGSDLDGGPLDLNLARRIRVRGNVLSAPAETSPVDLNIDGRIRFRGQWISRAACNRRRRSCPLAE